MLGEVDPRRRCELARSRLGGLTQQRLGPVRIPSYAESLGERHPEAPRGGLLGACGLQHLDRPLALAAGVEVLHRPADDVRVAGVLGDAPLPGLPRELLLAALVREDRGGGAVPPDELAVGRVRVDPAAELRDRVARLLAAIEREVAEDHWLVGVQVVRIDLDQPLTVGDRRLGIHARVRVRVRPHLQDLDGVGVLAQEFVADGNRVREVAGRHRRVGQLQAGRQAPLGILHRLAQGPLREAALARRGQREAIA